MASFTWFEKFDEAFGLFKTEEDRERMELAAVKYGSRGIDTVFENDIWNVAFYFVKDFIDNSINSKKTGAKGGNSKASKGGKQKVSTPLEQTCSTQYKTVQDSTVQNSNKKGCRFTPPSLAEVKAYVEENNLTFVDPESIYGYYDSQGWTKANGQKLTNWKSAISGANARARKEAEEEANDGKPKSTLAQEYGTGTW